MPLRWGVLGAARIAQQQVIPAIRRSDAGEVLAVSSASGRAVPYARELGIPRAYAAHDELLADPDVDAIYIALPNIEHAAWARRAARAGKHILCEKPLVTGLHELEDLERECRRAGVQLVEAFMYRHHPQLGLVRQLLQDGVVGDIVALHARLHFLLERTEDGDIRLRADMAGGALLDLGCYPVDLFGSVLGREPDEVSALAHRDGADGVDTRLAAVLRYGDVLASLDCSFDAAFVNTASIVGSKGTIALSDMFRADRVGGLGTVVVEHDGRRDLHEVRGDQYAAEVRAFAERVRTGSGGRDEDELSRRTAATLERIARAAGLR